MRKFIVTLAVGLGLSAAALTVNVPNANAGDYGKCTFDSECHSGAKCNGGLCSDAPGGKCNFDSECNGKKCSGGTCK
jgi:hypothetical protein